MQLLPNVAYCSFENSDIRIQILTGNVGSVNTTITVSYPDGYTVDNTIVLYRSVNKNGTWYTQPDVTGMLRVNLTPANIILINTDSSTAGGMYKIVLSKQ